MVQHRLDHVRMDLDIAHASSNGSPDIAQLPRLHRAVEVKIERVLGASPFGEAANRSGAEQVVTLAERKRHADNIERPGRQIYEMGTAVLRTLLGQFPGAGIQIEFPR